MLVLDRADVAALLSPPRCLEAMEGAMIALIEGRAVLPPRTVLPLPDGAAALFMPAALATPSIVGTKVVTICPGNHRHGLASHHAGLLAFEAERGTPVALLDDRLAALEEAGELLVPMAEGAVDATHIRADLGEVAAGRHPGRIDDREVTLFKSVGLAIQDLAAAAVVIAEAERRGSGRRIDWS